MTLTQPISRRRMIAGLHLAAGALLAPRGALGAPKTGKLATTHDLQADARIAARDRRPILLLVSQEECPFCWQIKREILDPMVLSGDYDDRLLMREMFIDEGFLLRDFQGREVAGGDFALRYGVSLTPTLLFLDPRGRELTDKMVGIQTPEMYFLYVDAAITEAVERMRGGE